MNWQAKRYPWQQSQKAPEFRAEPDARGYPLGTIRGERVQDRGLNKRLLHRIASILAGQSSRSANLRRSLHEFVRAGIASGVGIDKLRQVMDEEMALVALHMCGGNQSRAARALGVHRNTEARLLHNWVRRLGRMV